ncbi:protein male-specific lethal-1-like [Malaya genurostris]|uniref:protein male-specific lethal-1-like n=1 Tax=Malaya genurostris TaxID=325434 RepID=UPI0026F37FB9|nr:protein male-specific lethal-1-like [Malaya genurostris]
MMMENLDHVYCNTASTDVGSKDSTEQMSLFKEVKQLQSILLLHLDLIQEQSDQILAKDKLIIKLKDENEILKHQLELVNKRMQHMKQQKEQREVSIPVRNVTADKVFDYNSRIIPSAVEQPASGEHIPELTSTVRNIKKEVVSSDYDGFDSICQDFTGELESDIKIENNEIEEEIFLNYSKSDDESGPSSDLPPVVSQPVKDVRPPSSSTPISYDVSISQSFENIADGAESNSSNHNNNNKNVNNQLQTAGQHSAKDAAACGDEKVSNYNPLCSSGNSSDGSLTKKSYSTSFMITEKPYISCNWKDEAITNELERLLENEAAELEIPCWTIINDSYDNPSGSSEVTSENISDEAYMKRHAKFELDERRRKKWDVQRIREQKNIERLKKRHLKTDSDNEQKNIGSFYPSIESIKYIHIIDEIPVQAFGELIPVLPATSFSLPWMMGGIDTTENVTPSEFGPGPLFSAATGVPTPATATSAASTITSSSTEGSQEIKTKFLHRLAPNLAAQRQRFTKRVKKET